MSVTTASSLRGGQAKANTSEQKLAHDNGSDASTGVISGDDDYDDALNDLSRLQSEDAQFRTASVPQQERAGGQQSGQMMDSHGNSHLMYLEDQIKNLESRLRQVEHAAELRNREPAHLQAADKPETQLRTIFMTWPQFVTPRMISKQPFIHLIEVCIEPPRSLSLAELQKMTKDAQTEGHLDSSLIDPNAIQRFRIRSTVLNGLLSTILGTYTPQSMESHIRPFKAIVRGKQGLMDKYEQLTRQQKRYLAVEEEEPREDEELRCQLEYLLQFIAGLFRPIMERYEQLSLRTRSSLPLTASFHELWYVFEPGRFIHHPRWAQAYIVLGVTGGRPVLRNREPNRDPPEPWTKSREGTTNSLHISVAYLSYNGKEIGPVQYEIVINPYEGYRYLTSLPVYPLACADQRNEARPVINLTTLTDGRSTDNAGESLSISQQLELRGTKYLELIKSGKPSHKDYRGFTIGQLREQIESRVIIDFEFFYKSRVSEVPELGLTQRGLHDIRETSETLSTPCLCGVIRCNNMSHWGWGIFLDIDIDEKMHKEFREQHTALVNWDSSQEKLMADYVCLLPRGIPGFVLHNRAWNPLDIDNITDIVSRKESFDHLELNKEHKRVVEAVVRRHAAGAKPVASIKADQDAFLDDLVRGKGKGVIILLHGVPGVGKTSTAETVADLTGRPLFALTCGDVGTTASEVQTNLDECFKLAHRWGCVMLLDEADVFLQQRDRTNMQRNAIVSVFLRVLEYYSGILFLTTNKIGTFDEAFKSRIHIALFYGPLKWPAAKRIWENNLDRVQKARPHMKMNRDRLLDWADKEWHKSEDQGKTKKTYRPWNGRQIHNACQTAASLAEHAAYGSLDDLPPNAKVWLKKEHLVEVARAIREFDKYLVKTHGTDDFGRAAEAMDRGDDRYGAPPRKPARRRRRAEDAEEEDEDEDDDDDEEEEEDEQGGEE